MKTKEQLVTDMICGIPETLHINLNAQEIEPLGKRICLWMFHEFLTNWLKDPFTAFLFVLASANIVFYIVALSL
jgi:hypothetical protein